MIGSSYAFGENVPIEQSLAGLLPLQLSRRTNRKAQLYNEGMFSCHPRCQALQFGAVLAAQPDLILWILTATDIKKASYLLPDSLIPQSLPEGVLERTKYRLRQAMAMDSIPSAFSFLKDHTINKFADSETGVMLTHALYMNQALYIRSYVSDNSDSFLLGEKLSDERRANVKEFQTYAAQIEGQANAAGVPLAAVFVPERVRATMLSMEHPPAGYSPNELDDVLRSIIVSHGGVYLDILANFHSIRNPEQYYQPVDDHPIPQGYAIISELIAKEITKGAVPAFTVANQPKAAVAEMR